MLTLISEWGLRCENRPKTNSQAHKLSRECGERPLNVADPSQLPWEQTITTEVLDENPVGEEGKM